jgi:hypothetical protein
MALPLEAETYVPFGGAFWWLSEIFPCRGKTYAHLMRDPNEDKPAGEINYAEVIDGKDFMVVPESDSILVKRAYRAQFLRNVLKYGEVGIPVVGVRRKNGPSK